MSVEQFHKTNRVIQLVTLAQKALSMTKPCALYEDIIRPLYPRELIDMEPVRRELGIEVNDKWKYWTEEEILSDVKRILKPFPVLSELIPDIERASWFIKIIPSLPAREIEIDGVKIIVCESKYPIQIDVD